jgi:hypothetical protein
MRNEVFTLTAADIRKLGRRAARTVLRELALSSDREVIATVRRWARINLPRAAYTGPQNYGLLSQYGDTPQ